MPAAPLRDEKSALAHAGLSRREFVRLAAVGSVGLMFGVSRDGGVFATATAAPATFAPNQWISIDTSGRVTIRAHKTEMGQGVRTSLPAIVAAELGADWASVKIEHAAPGVGFADMGTSGSGSVSDSWKMLRRAAAVARWTLTSAAAARWSVPAGECVVANGVVTHPASNRRASFAQLVTEAASIPVPHDAPLRPDSELTILGTRLRRVDAHDIVTGRAVYGIDARPRGMRVATIARPPVAGATLRSCDEMAARAVAGVERVVHSPRGVAVVARDTWSAMRGRTALDARWDMPASDTTHLMSSQTALENLEAALDHGKVARHQGDVAAARAGAGRHLEATFHAPFQAHAAMEPLNCVADVRSDRCEVWVGTQRPNGVQAFAAKLLGIAPEKVTVHVTLLGGAFGRRIAIDYAQEAIELSQAIGAPVQVLWTREDDFAHDWYQAAQVNRLSASLDAEGNITAWRHQVGDYHLTMFGPRDPNSDPAKEGDPWGGFDSPYAFPALEVTLAELDPPVPTGAWRSVTYPAAVFARESFLDEVAHATNRDPLALRLSLLGDARQARLRNVLELAAEKGGWPAQPVSRDGRRWGRGLACNPYHGETFVAQVADVSVGRDGDIRVHRVVTALDCGRVIDRSGLEGQIEGGVAWALSATLKTEITLANGRAEQTNFNAFPVLRMREMPVQEIVIVEGAATPGGAGEPPVPAVGPAVANALFAATGVRARRTPIRL